MRHALAAVVVTTALVANADCDILAAPRVSYGGGVFKATVCVQECPDATCYLGATLHLARDGSTFDLPAKEFKGSKTSVEVTLSEKVGPGFSEYAVAVWATKVPCDRSKEARQGCRDYGYLLVGNEESPLWGWPKWGWGWGQSEGFDSITPIRVQVLDAGAGQEVVSKTHDVLKAQHFTTVDGGKAQKPRFRVEVLYRNAWDRAAARKLVELLKKAEVGIRWEVAPWPEAPEAFVVALGQ